MGSRPQGTKLSYTATAVFFALSMVYMLFCWAWLTIKGVQATLANLKQSRETFGQNFGETVSALFGNRIFHALIWSSVLAACAVELYFGIVVSIGRTLIHPEYRVRDARRLSVVSIIAEYQSPTFVRLKTILSDHPSVLPIFVNIKVVVSLPPAPPKAPPPHQVQHHVKLIDERIGAAGLWHFTRQLSNQ